MTAYYNEFDPKAAAWLRELIRRNLIAPGDVDERSILDVRPDDLTAYTQCHFFAGIGVWSYALRQAGWPDDRPVWTGSCPCQPFSAAGRRAGLADERHLWPAWFWLINQRKPCAVFGEQVASRDGYDWLDAVRDDMEGAGYSIGAVDLCAAGFGAPHIRQRLFFVADAAKHGHQDGEPGSGGDGERVEPRTPGEQSGTLRPASCGMDDPKGDGWGVHDSTDVGQTDGEVHISANSGDSPDNEPRGERPAASVPGPTNGFWRDADWIRCRDGRWRPVEPGSTPLVAGASARMGRLRGYGNAINAEVAKGFIAAYMEASS